jgi:predicted small lipoprotein YifL
MKKTLASLFAIALAASLTACGGGGSEPAPVEVVAADTTIPTTAATAPAVVNVPFTFPAGVPDFGTTGTTTLAFTSTTTTPAFSIASGGNTATGTTTFGSCHFLVTASTFPSTSKLALGQTIIVNPCNISVSIAGQAANGVAATHSAALILGAAVSAGESVTIAVNPGGQLTLNGQSVGTVTLKPVTG